MLNSMFDGYTTNEETPCSTLPESPPSSPAPRAASVPPSPVRCIRPAPLSPREMVTDQTVRDLAHGGDERGYGEISIEDQAVLAMILPDICGELLARRAVALKDAAQ